MEELISEQDMNNEIIKINDMIVDISQEAINNKNSEKLTLRTKIRKKPWVATAISAIPILWPCKLLTDAYLGRDVISDATIEPKEKIFKVLSGSTWIATRPSGAYGVYKSFFEDNQTNIQDLEKRSMITITLGTASRIFYVLSVMYSKDVKNSTFSKNIIEKGRKIREKGGNFSKKIRRK